MPSLSTMHRTLYVAHEYYTRGRKKENNGPKAKIVDTRDPGDDLVILENQSTPKNVNTNF